MHLPSLTLSSRLPLQPLAPLLQIDLAVYGCCVSLRLGRARIQRGHQRYHSGGSAVLLPVAVHEVGAAGRRSHAARRIRIRTHARMHVSVNESLCVVSTERGATGEVGVSTGAAMTCCG